MNKYIVFVKKRIQLVGHVDARYGFRQPQLHHVRELFEHADADRRNSVAHRQHGALLLPAFVLIPCLGIRSRNTALAAYLKISHTTSGL